MPILSSFMCKPILLLFEAKLESKICGGLLNKKTKKLDYMFFGENEFKQIIKPKKIEYSGEHAVVVINNLCMKRYEDIDFSRYFFAPLGKQVFTTDGKLIGNVTDLELDAGFFCTAFLIENERLPIEMVITLGGDLVLVKGERCPKINRYVTKKVRMPKDDKIKVRILDEDGHFDFGDFYPATQPITLAYARDAQNEQTRVACEIEQFPKPTARVMEYSENMDFEQFNDDFVSNNETDNSQAETANIDLDIAECNNDLSQADNTYFDSSKASDNSIEADSAIIGVHQTDSGLTEVIYQDSDNNQTDNSQAETTNTELDTAEHINDLSQDDMNKIDGGLTQVIYQKSDINKIDSGLIDLVKKASSDSNFASTRHTVENHTSQNIHNNEMLGIDEELQEFYRQQSAENSSRDKAYDTQEKTENGIVGDDSKTHDESFATRIVPEVLMPTRVICDYGFLLGRRVTKNIFSYSQDLLAKKGEVVTTILVNKVQSFGKLVELTLNSKN